MRKKSLLLIVMVFALASLTTIHAQEKKSLIGDYLSISGWMNIQYDYESQLQNGDESLEVISNTFNVRRARLDVKGNINKNVEFRVQGDFAGTPKLVDGFVKVKLHKSFNIQAGQFKIPFTFENPQSPLTLEGIEYAQVISKLSGYSDMSGVKTYSGGRDVGVMIYGNFFSFERNGKEIPILTYKLGVFNGNGMNNKDANFLKDIAGSIEVCPGVKGLMLAASYYGGNYNLAAANENNANRDRLTFGGKYENGRLTVRSEYITGKTDMANNGQIYTLDSDGFYVAGGYWFNIAKDQRIRPVARYDFFRQDVHNPEKNSTYYMVGIDWWPYKNLRLLVNYTMKDKPGFENMGNLWQAQLSVKF
ncbi:MAG: hypothetical protein IIX06_07605 [Bacteroidales bacterium]|nr:hypothetical protein [Bacteroidales bacterium]